MTSIVESSNLSVPKMPSGPLSPPSPTSVQRFPTILCSDAPLCEYSPKKKKTVRFSSITQVKNILSRHDMSLDECCNYWLQEYEFRLIKQRDLVRIQEAVEELQADEHNEVETTHLTARQESKYENEYEYRSKSRTVEDLLLPGPESSSRKECPSWRSDAIDDDVLFEKADRHCASLYDDEGFDDPFAEVYFDTTGNC